MGERPTKDPHRHRTSRRSSREAPAAASRFAGCRNAKELNGSASSTALPNPRRPSTNPATTTPPRRGRLWREDPAHRSDMAGNTHVRLRLSSTTWRGRGKSCSCAQTSRGVATPDFSMKPRHQRRPLVATRASAVLAIGHVASIHSCVFAPGIRPAPRSAAMPVTWASASRIVHAGQAGTIRSESASSSAATRSMMRVRVAW